MRNFFIALRVPILSCVVVFAGLAFLVACRSTSESQVAGLIQREMEQGQEILELPPAKQRAKLHRTLDQAKTESDGIHDACIMLQDVGDSSSVPHLIRALRFFGDAELPLPKGVGIICTHQHCVDALEHITGAKPGISCSSWKRWWEATHPGQQLDDPPHYCVNPTAGADTHGDAASPSARRR
jgi:hypothetical protein